MHIKKKTIYPEIVVQDDFLAHIVLRKNKIVTSGNSILSMIVTGYTQRYQFGCFSLFDVRIHQTNYSCNIILQNTMSIQTMLVFVSLY